MAFAATLKKVNGSSYGHSIGPVAVEYWDFTVASADVAGTISSNLHNISHVELMGLVQTALPSVNNTTNVITFAFADPAATVKGHVRVYGVK